MIATPLAHPLTALDEAVTSFALRPKAHEPAADTARCAVEIRRLIDRLELEFSECVAIVEESGYWDADGSTSPVDWVRHNTQMSGHAASQSLCVGRQLATLADSFEAVADGQIGFAHLALMARVAERVGEADGPQVFDEQALLSKARECSVGRFRHVCDHARHSADPDGYAREQAKAVEARTLHITSNGEEGLIFIRGVLDQEGGAALRTALEPLARRKGEGDKRVRARRLADALVELTGHALDSKRLPGRPHLQLTSSIETLLGLKGACAAELEFSTPVSGDCLRRIACDCTISRVILDSESMVIDVGRAQRVVPGATRRALNVRDKGCVWPGCDRPASRTQAHHLIHWCRGGETNLANTILLCHRHHWMVHEGGWQIIRGADGTIFTVRPPVQFDRMERDLRYLFEPPDPPEPEPYAPSG